MTRTQTEQDKERQSRRVNGEIELIDVRCNAPRPCNFYRYRHPGRHAVNEERYQGMEAGQRREADDDKVENGIENEMGANAMYQCNAVRSDAVLPRRPLLIRLQIQPAHIRVDIVAAPRHRSLVNVFGDRNTRTAAVRLSG